jgi:hypothetical protein
MVPQPYRFSLCFLHRYGNLTIVEFSSKWVKGYDAIQRERVLPVVEGGEEVV